MDRSSSTSHRRKKEMTERTAIEALVNETLPEERRAEFLKEHGLDRPESGDGADYTGREWTKAALQEEADERGLDYDSGATKAELQALLIEHDASDDRKGDDE